jgi:GT2 family glycosyltransferase
LLVQPPVSVIVPTYNREDRHYGLYQSFAHQNYEPKTLHVLDDSPRPSKFFTGLADPRVYYFHSPRRMSIGAKRNALIAHAGGQIMSAFDDDDLYARGYLSAMVGALGDHDLVKLSNWTARSEYDGSLWRWDTATTAPLHYAVSGSAPPMRIRGREIDPDTQQAAIDGYGFSYVFPKRAWAMAGGFDDISLGEDLSFVRKLRRAGGRVAYVGAFPDIVSHTMHSKSTSKIYPQHCLSSGCAGIPYAPEPKRVRSIALRPGATYDAVAHVSKARSTAAIRSLAAGRDLHILSMSEEPADANGYRYVRARLVAGPNVPRKLPASMPWPFSVYDRTGLVSLSVNGQSVAVG